MLSFMSIIVAITTLSLLHLLALSTTRSFLALGGAEIMETTETNKQQPRLSGRPALFALREVIRAELEQGWTMATIHRRYADQLGISYCHFARYVAAYIGKPVKPVQTKAGGTAPGVLSCGGEGEGAPMGELIVTIRRES